jgi:hypothetical protein
MGEVWKVTITDSLNRFLEKVIVFLPNLLAMITILVVGFLIAWIFKKLLFRFLKAIQFDRVSRQWGLADVLSKGGVTLILGINALEVAATQNLITHFFNYLPHFFAAMIILVIGYLIATFLGRATLIAAVNAEMESARVLSQLVRWFLIILSLTMALYQLGIAEKVIVAAFSVIFGGIVLALAIAFGWGGRELAKGFLERLYKREGKGSEKQDHISHI